jgi:hypothetical protein
MIGRKLEIFGVGDDVFKADVFQPARRTSLRYIDFRGSSKRRKFASDVEAGS